MDGRAFMMFGVWQQTSSISFNMDFLCSIHTEATLQVIAFLELSLPVSFSSL